MEKLNEAAGTAYAAFEAIETELDDPSAYRAVEETVVVAPLRERVRVLDRACGGALEPRWRAFKERYAKALDAHLEALRAVMDARLAARTAPYADALAPTAAELRRNAIYNNYRALVDFTTSGGFGRAATGIGCQQEMAGSECSFTRFPKRSIR